MNYPCSESQPLNVSEIVKEPVSLQKSLSYLMCYSATSAMQKIMTSSTMYRSYDVTTNFIEIPSTIRYEANDDLGWFRAINSFNKRGNGSKVDAFIVLATQTVTVQLIMTVGHMDDVARDLISSDKESDGYYEKFRLRHFRTRMFSCLQSLYFHWVTGPKCSPWVDASDGELVELLRRMPFMLQPSSFPRVRYL